MKASEMIDKLKKLISEYGDKELWHEDNGCQGCSLSDVIYDEDDCDFRVI